MCVFPNHLPTQNLFLEHCVCDFLTVGKTTYSAFHKNFIICVFPRTVGGFTSIASIS